MIGKYFFFKHYLGPARTRRMMRDVFTSHESDPLPIDQSQNTEGINTS